MTGTRSEIDDIFASKSKGTSSAQPVASSSTSGPGSSTLPKKKKKDKKRKLEAIEVDEPLEAPVENPPKRRVPVTVVDASSSSSLSVPPPPKPKSAKKLSTAPLSKPKNKEKDQKELEQFKDSRGTGPRRQTEEGFSIFKEAELGINVEAGGTPLCPFDCDCCVFARSNGATLTYGQALADWLAHCEDTPDDEEGLKSAKNFARAFNIWYNKAMKPATTYSDQIYPDMLWYNIEQFAWDFELEADPILERLDPGSKTKRIATNYGRFAKYLHERKVVDDNDLKQSTRAVGMLEDDLRRMQRASWVLRQNDVARTFGTKVGNEFRPVSSDERRAILNGENGEDQTYEIAHMGENFVLADKCDDLGCAVSSADNPVKIRLPVSAIMYLKPGDTIDATFEKAKGGDYWVIQMFTGVDSGTDKFEENKLIWTRSDEEIAKYMGPKETYAEKLKAIRSTREYRERWDELLKTAPPADALFPEETFTVEWFEKRETDIGSDDEIGAMWDTTSDGDGEERLDYLE